MRRSGLPECAERAGGGDFVGTGTWGGVRAGMRQVSGNRGVRGMAAGVLFAEA
jgi:hypothetical protein